MRICATWLALLMASGCCLSVDPEGIGGGTGSATGGTGGSTTSRPGVSSGSSTGTHGRTSSSGGNGATSGGAIPDAGPCGETCSFPTAQTVGCNGSVLSIAASLGQPFDFQIAAFCGSSTTLSWSVAEATTLPEGLSFQEIGTPPVGDITGMPSSLPNPNPALLSITVSDGSGDIGHLQVILTVN